MFGDRDVGIGLLGFLGLSWVLDVLVGLFFELDSGAFQL